MIQPKNIHSLTDFQRNAKEHIEKLRETGEPHVLTVNGKAEVIVQNAEAYQKLLDQLDYWDTVRVLRERLKDLDDPSKWIPLPETFEKFEDLVRNRGET